jgi:DNA polymerase-3 subunit gamma/tau
MSYQVLARKWRPHKFDEVVGQQHVLQSLIHALDGGRLHHAYLLTGTRGVGKTTLSRILAKCLNCEKGVTSIPCGECSACTQIDAGRFIDLIEIDAASKTKVEDTRELLDNVQFAPVVGRFKIYLIDEVHMLSTHSFNALLKTLEEPPEHVKFLLATTDPQKLPITVLSRCLQFHLKNIPADLIAKQLAYVLENEEVTFDAPALDAISRNASGSMRDALSLLDQAIAYGQGTVKKDAVLDMLGNSDDDQVVELAMALAQENADMVFNICAQLHEHQTDYIQVLGR